MLAFWVFLMGLFYTFPIIIVAWILEALIFRHIMDSPIWGWVVSTAAAWFVTALIYALYYDGPAVIMSSLMFFFPAFVVAAALGTLWRLYRVRRGDFGSKDVDPDVFN